MLIDNTLANVLYSINESSLSFLDNEQTINLMLDLKAVLCQAHILLSANDMHTPGMHGHDTLLVIYWEQFLPLHL